MELNTVLNHVGEFGMFQCFSYCLALIPSIIAGITVLAPVFTLGEPKYRCFVDVCDVDSIQNDSWIDFALPKDKFGFTEQCLKFVESNYSNASCVSETFTANVTKCHKYVFDENDFKETAVTEWNIVCTEDWKISFAKSFAMAGILMSALVFGYLSDRFGRKRCFYWSPIGAVVCLMISSFSTNFTTYAILAPFITFFVTGMYQTAYVLGMEFVGNKWRILCGNGVQIAFSVGELILCGIAYSTKKWRHIQMFIAGVAASLLIYPFLLSESIRWNMSKGNYINAVKTLEKAAKWNKATLPDNVMFQLKEISTRDEESKHSKVSVSVVFKHAILRRWTLNLFFCWAVNALVYYGLSLQASSIGSSSLYVSFAFLAAIEIPFIVAINFLMERFGQKLSLIAAMVIGGISCIVSALLPQASMYFAVIGKGCIAASFSLIYVYTIEIYPTAVRTVSMGMCVMSSRIGAIAAPFISQLEFFGKFGPIILCGVLSLISGLLALDLPETSNQNLPETIADVEKLKRFNLNRQKAKF